MSNKISFNEDQGIPHITDLARLDGVEPPLNSKVVYEVGSDKYLGCFNGQNWIWDKPLPYTSDTLPDPATLGAGEMVVVEGVPNIHDGEEFYPLGRVKRVHMNSKYGFLGNGEDVSTALLYEQNLGKMCEFEEGNYVISSEISADYIRIHGLGHAQNVVFSCPSGFVGFMFRPLLGYDIDGIKLIGTGAAGQYGVGNNIVTSIGRGYIRNFRHQQLDFGIFFDDLVQHPIGLNYSHIYGQSFSTAGIVIGGKGAVATAGEDGFYFEECLLTNATFSEKVYSSTVAQNSPTTSQDTVSWDNTNVPYFGYMVLRSADGSTNWHVPPNWYKCDFVGNSFSAQKTVGETWTYKVVKVTHGLSVARAKNVTITTEHCENFTVGAKFKDCKSVNITTGYCESRGSNYVLAAVVADNSIVRTGPFWNENGNYFGLCLNNGSIRSESVSVGSGIKWALFGLAGSTNQSFKYESSGHNPTTTPLYRAIGDSTYDHIYSTMLNDTPNAILRNQISHHTKAAYSVAYRGVEKGSLSATSSGSLLDVNAIHCQPASLSLGSAPLVNSVSAIKTSLSTSVDTSCLTFTVPSNGAGTLDVDFSIRIYDGSSVARQVVSGKLKIAVVRPSTGTAVCGLSTTNVAKAIQQGTITDPANWFTATVASDTVTIKVAALTSSVTNITTPIASAQFSLVSSTGFDFAVTQSA